MSFSTFTDRTGQSWSIPDLLGSGRPRVTRYAWVSDLLSEVIQAERWGPEVGTTGSVLELAQSLHEPVADWLDETSLRGFASRIRALAQAFEEGKYPEPLVIGPDGQLWDGLHRLCAVSLLGRLWVQVLDFHQALPSALCAPLLATHLQQSAVLDQLRTAFYSAPGYPHLTLRPFLEHSLAAGCLTEINNLSWHRQETDFYSQNEFLLLPNDPTLPPHLRQLAGALHGTALLEFLQSLTGNTLLCQPEVVLHCHNQGDYVGVHNDFRCSGERLRLVIYLGTDQASLEDGAFVVLGDKAGEQVLDYTVPAHNAAVLFAISPRSFHMVTEVQSTRRYSVVLSYYESPPPTAGDPQSGSM